MPVHPEPSFTPQNANTRRRVSALKIVVLVVCAGLWLTPLVRLTVAAAPLLQETATPTPLPGTGSLAGLIWNDANGNGARDAGEAPLAGTVVSAQNADTGAASTATSDAAGSYRITGLVPAVYRVTVTPPAGWTLTTNGARDAAVAAGAVVTLDFGARLVPTSTPTATPDPILDTSNAQPLACGGVYLGDTFSKANNVSSYGCRPYWNESGPEAVYRLELEASQPVTATLLSASADLDLFFLRFSNPSSCLAAGDAFLSQRAGPGIYFLAVDGYQGAAGSFTFRIDCPANTQATATPTYTPSPTPTFTPTGTPTATPSSGPSPLGNRLYLPVIMRSQSATGPAVTLTLQEGLNGYVGTTDTTLDSWEPQVAQGGDNRVRLFYARPPKVTTQMAPVVRFDLSLLPAGAQVRSALLRLYMPSTPPYDLRARAHGLLKPWAEDSATWELAATGQPWEKPGAAGEGVDRTVWATDWQRIGEGGRWYEFDVTTPAQGWATQPQSNYGVVLSAGPGDADATVQAQFVSREGNGNFRPQLIISYVLPTQ